MAYDFPALPTENQQFTPSGGPTYIYKNDHWTVKQATAGAADWDYITNKPATFPPTVPIDWANISSKPVSYPPTVHVHAIADTTNLQSTLDSKLPLAGGIMSGHITLPVGTPASTQAAPVSYVDTKEPALPAGGNTTHYLRGDKTWQVLTIPSTDWSAITNKPATFPPSAHTHLWADITNPPATFTPSAHVHAQADVTGLVAALAAKEPTISAGTTSQYWRGDKSWVAFPTTMTPAAHTHLWVDITDKPSTFAPSAHTHDWTTGVTGKPSTFAPSAHSHPISEVTNLQTALDAKESLASKGVANGYASLDATAKVPASQLPAYVDDVQEFANLAAFPGTGTVGIIYVALDTNKTYRWGGSSYTEISPSPGSTDAVPEGAINFYHTTARASAAAPVQSVNTRTGAITLTQSDVGLSNVDNTSDVNKPVSAATATALSGKAATSHTHAQADVTNLTTDLSLKAPLADPVFTGDPRAPTPATSDNDTSIATTAYVKANLSGFVAGADGGILGGDFKFNTSTGSTIAAGDVQVNNATIGSATALYISDISTTGQYIASLFAAASNYGDFIELRAKGASSPFTMFRLQPLTMSPSLPSGGRVFTVFSVSTSGGTPANGAALAVTLIKSSKNTSLDFYQLDSTTTAASMVNGQVRFNGTSQIHFSYMSATGVHATGALASLQAGSIIAYRSKAGTTNAETIWTSFTVTGAPTKVDGFGGYITVPVSLLAAGSSGIPPQAYEFTILPGASIAPDVTKAYVDAADATKVNKAGDTMTGPLVYPAGSQSATSINFGTSGTGLYGTATTVGTAISGSLGAILSATAFNTYLPINIAHSGNATTSSLQFINTPGLGFYATASDISLTIGGVLRYTFGNAALTSTLPVICATAPSAGSHLCNKTYVDARPSAASMSDSAPSSPVNGQFWVETTTMNMYVYYTDGSSNQWVQVGGA